MSNFQFFNQKSKPKKSSVISRHPKKSCGHVTTMMPLVFFICPMGRASTLRTVISLPPSAYTLTVVQTSITIGTRNASHFPLYIAFCHFSWCREVVPCSFTGSQRKMELFSTDGRFKAPSIDNMVVYIITSAI